MYPRIGKSGQSRILTPGESVRVLVDELVERRPSIAQTAIVAVGEENAVRTDVEPVSLGHEDASCSTRTSRAPGAGPRPILDDLPRTREQHLGSVVLA